MPKTQPLCTGAKLNLRDRFGWSRKEWLYWKRTQCPSKLCVPTWWGHDEEFYWNFKGGVADKDQGLHSFNLPSVGLLMSLSRFSGIECWHLPFIGVFSSIKSTKDIFRCFPWGGTRTLPKVALLFLDCSSLSLHPLPSLIRIVQICPLELRDAHGGWRLFPTNKKRGTKKGLCAQESHRVLLSFSDSNKMPGKEVAAG